MREYIRRSMRRAMEREAEIGFEDRKVILHVTTYDPTELEAAFAVQNGRYTDEQLWIALAWAIKQRSRAMVR